MGKAPKVLPPEKTPTGVPGFDGLTGGGIPRNRVVVIAGSAGAGKTVFALQSLVYGATVADEPGIFVAFEENSVHVKANAASFGWELGAIPSAKLCFIDAQLRSSAARSGAFDLVGLLSIVSAKAKAMGAKRIVFDGVDLLLSHLDDQAAERHEVLRLDEWIRQSDLTCILTAKMEAGDAPAFVRYGFLQFMADCVIHMNHYVAKGLLHRRIRIVKYRGSGFAENEYPFIIDTQGIEVHETNTDGYDYVASSERVQSGVDGLDAMLEGGYYRGSVTLISGSPGAAKSTLAAAFTDRACQRGERSLYISFDEAPSEMVRNFESVGIKLGRHVKSGRLIMHSIYADGISAEEQLLRVRRLIRRHKPRNLVLDPISAVSRLDESMGVAVVAPRIVRIVKQEGITTVFTSLLEGHGADLEASASNVSTIADTWIHLSYHARGGERNRALTIIKSRGTGHSSQVRELCLDKNGPSLKDVYTAGGDILMGTARWEREQSEQRDAEREARESTRKRRALELKEAEIAARIEALVREDKSAKNELLALAEDEARHQASQTSHTDTLRRRRESKPKAPRKRATRDGDKR